MIYSDKILTIADKVNFTSLLQYLLIRGWRKHDTSKPDIIALYAPNDDPNSDILLPLSRNYSDYSKSILSAIRKVSEYENRDGNQIINDLLLPPADILRFRIDNEETNSGLISLKAGFDLLESAKKSLLAAASDVISPSLFHARMSHKEVVNFIDACQLGQTERGSYIASIVCPFIRATREEHPTQLTIFSSEEALKTSFTRLVTKRLLYSVQHLKRQIELGQTDTLLDPNSQNLISANLLESLVEMNEFTQHSKIEISATWAPTVPLPEDVPSSVEIGNDYIEPIKAIIDRMRPEAIETTGEYVGKISALKADPDLNNRIDGEITFIFISDEQKAISAKVVLEGKDLSTALRAFEEGKNVLVSGVLKTYSRQRTIESPTFRVIE